MAKKTIVELVDDLDGGTAEETIEFGMEGASYTIDLSSENAERLRAALAPFIEAGTRMKRSTGRQRTSSTGDQKPSREAVRAWAAEQGLTVAARGRVAAEVMDAYEAAH